MEVVVNLLSCVTMIWIIKTGLGAVMPISFPAQQISGIIYVYTCSLPS